MKKMLSQPLVASIVTGILLIIVCSFFPIPMYDGVFYYKNGLMQFESEGKVALYYFFDLKSKQLTLYGLQPVSFELKKMGWVIAGLIHVGLPTLIGLRIFYAQAKNRLEQNNASNQPQKEDE